jgi:hypothetical protein
MKQAGWIGLLRPDIGQQLAANGITCENGNSELT